MEQLLIPALALGILVAAALFLARLTACAGRRARLGPDGVQEQEIIVLDGYTPDTVVVQEGVPVRLKFTRLETTECSDRVVFSGLKVSRRLPPYRTTMVEFVPLIPGEYLFTCAMGMYRGKLLVEPRGARRFRLPWRSERPQSESSQKKPGEKTHPC